MPDETAPETDDPAAEAEEPQGSVFGNLPRTRPGTRSPRRRERRASPRAPSEAQPDRAEPAADAASPQSATEPARPVDAEGEGGGFEDLAWAGVAAAAEAATLGVRLANRALEAVKDAVERR